MSQAIRTAVLVLQILALAIAAVLLGSLAAGAVDEDAPHGDGRSREKVPAIPKREPSFPCPG